LFQPLEQDLSIDIIALLHIRGSQVLHGPLVARIGFEDLAIEANGIGQAAMAMVGQGFFVKKARILVRVNGLLRLGFGSGCAHGRLGWSR
jgi:hypothetical protein